MTATKSMSGKKVADKKGNGKAKTSPPARIEYADVMAKLNGTLKDVKPILVDGEKVQPRRFHLTPDELNELRDQYKTTKKFPMPFRRGAYRGFVAALIALGPNKAHSFKSVRGQMKNEMAEKDGNGKTEWERFAKKEAHSDVEENCKDVDGKIHQNAEVLQRLGGLTPYGYKLVQLGQILKTKGVTVDILKGKNDEPMYRLNLNSNEPINEFRRQRSK